MHWKASHSRSDDQTQYPLHIVHDVEHVNKHFASVCFDPNYSVADVMCFKRTLHTSYNSDIVLAPYEVERFLSTMKASSPGLDNIPHWLFRTCSFEIAEVVTHVLNLFLTVVLCLGSG